METKWERGCARTMPARIINVALALALIGATALAIVH